MQTLCTTVVLSFSLFSREEEGILLLRVNRGIGKVCKTDLNALIYREREIDR